MAGRNIKGITIEIGGDTTKLDKALQGVNKSLRTAQSNLKDVNRLLKLDPKNTELLKQKYENLQKAIKDTKEKLDTLKEAEEQLTKEMADGGTKEQQEQLAALKREIIATEQSLQGLEGEVGSGSAALAQISAVTDDWSGKLEAVGQAMMPVTAGLTALGAASVGAFKEVDSGMDTIVKKTGATGDALQEMQNIAKDLAKSIPTDFDTAGAAVGEVATRFDVTGKELEDLSSKFIKFADINDTDVTTAVDTAQAAMAAFGLSAQDASDFLDTLNAAGQATGTGVTEIASAMQTNAVALQEMGMSAADAANFIGNLDKAGIDSSQALAGLRKALQNATKEGVPLDQALSDLQDTLASADSNSEAFSSAMELFGSKAGPQFAKAIQDGRVSLDDLGKSLDATAGNVETTFENTQDPINDFQMTLNNIKEPLASLGQTLLELVAPLLERVADGAQKVSDWWNNLSPSTQQLIVKVAGLAAAIGPLALGLSKVFSVVSSVTGALSKVGSVMTFLTSPVGLVIAAIGLLVGAIILLWNKSEGFRNICIAVWNAIKAGVLAAINGIKAAFNKLKSAINTIKTAFNNVKTAIVQTWNNIKQAVTRGITNVVAKIRTLPSRIASTFTNLKDKALSWGKDMIQGFIDGITAKFEGLKEKFNSIGETAKSLLGFSVPEEGPMSDADTWMPDMIDLFIRGIKENEGRLQAAMQELAGGMVISPSLDAVSNANTFAIEAMLARYLPQIGNQAIILDDGTLVGKMAPEMARSVNQINYRKSKL